MESTALLTDRYELTMLDVALSSGLAERRSVFETFSRQLPDGRRYGVFAGLGRLVEALSDFRFGDEELSYLKAAGVVSDEALSYLEAFSFTGSIDAYAEGECYFPGSPVLTIEGSFGECVLIETLVLSICNFDSAVAAAASRMVGAAAGRPLIEMGARRTSERSAVAAARAAYLAGFASTSELEAGRRYGIPTVGTASHAFVLAYDDEEDAFCAQLDCMGTETTLLVDTFDVDEAIRSGVALSRKRGVSGPGAVRIDSGDLSAGAFRARALLDELGAETTRIVLTSDLDEYAIAALRDAPADAYGVGTHLVTGSGSPTASFVYKLVAIDRPSGDGLRDVAKLSPEKESLGGRKKASRSLDEEGRAREEVVAAAADADSGLRPGWRERSLQRRVLEKGQTVDLASLEEARQHHQASLSELGEEALDLSAGRPVIPTRFRRPGEAP